MTVEILLALAASLFTASASVAQRAAAAPAPGELTFSWRLVLFLLRRPLWLVGVLCMIGGFVFQLAALRIGTLSLVQPVISAELLFVFAYLALRHPFRVAARDWLAAAGMAAGLGGFLALAAPNGGTTEHTSAFVWSMAALATFGATGIVALLAVVPLRGGCPPTPARRAALLAVSAAITWGFVAAVIKELASHLSAGPGAVFTNWSPYVLVVTAAVGIFLVSNAFQAGSLAASQPALTIIDPLVASLLGVTLFGEHFRHSPLDVGGEAAALAVLVASVVLLSRSPLVRETTPGPGPGGDGRDSAHPERARPPQVPVVLRRPVARSRASATVGVLTRGLAPVRRLLGNESAQ